MKSLYAAPITLALLAAPAVAGDEPGCMKPPRPEPAPAPRMEVAFVLDTTGSMGTLLETAKRKIWAIANELARAKPSPELRIGLVAFRDRGDEYVTRVFDLDADLDRIYGELTKFQAGGGGDGPESVNEALRAAVTKLSWTKDASVLKVAFLVGDAPPHMDYDQDVPYAKSCEEAARAGIVINTLRCGGDPATEQVWTEVARLAEGVYATIPQEGSDAIATPFDGRLAELGTALAGTLVAFGDRKERVAAADKMSRAAEGAAAAGPPAAAEAVSADRAVLLAKARRLDASDLVAAVAEGSVKLEDIEEAKLPEEMKKMSAEERKDFVAKKSAEREALKKELGELETKRATFLADAARKAAAAGAKSAFDLEVAKTLRAQAAKKGFKFE
jgi:hypothetical protein